MSDEIRLEQGIRLAIQGAIISATEKLTKELATSQRLVRFNEIGYNSVVRERDSLEKQILELREALQHYANKSMWKREVIDSYSGDCSFFDWPGELGDEGWSIAEKALTAARKELDSDPADPPSEARPGDAWGAYRLCADGWWRLAPTKEPLQTGENAGLTTH